MATTSPSRTGRRSCRGSTRSCASAGRTSSPSWGFRKPDSLRLCTKAGYWAGISRVCAQKLHQRVHRSPVEERYALEQVSGQGPGGWEGLRRQGSLGRVNLERERGVRQARKTSSFRQGRVEAAQLVDQFALQRL